MIDSVGSGGPTTCAGHSDPHVAPQKAINVHGGGQFAHWQQDFLRYADLRDIRGLI
jgi:hypothetical protein